MVDVNVCTVISDAIVFWCRRQVTSAGEPEGGRHSDLGYCTTVCTVRALQ